jgi:phosphoribosylanthranilate isomerase
MQLKIKVCGITNVEDARTAVQAGADALGFIFAEGSPRRVSLKTAAKIIGSLPPFVSKVGVFVDAPAEAIQRAIDECGIDTVQFHGIESPAFCEQFRVATIKAIRVQSLESLEILSRYHTNGWLLDSYVPGHHGGTGKQFNWDLARQATKLGKPILLAGGLQPGNVAEAIRRVRPFGLDVSSGVESSPGKKDTHKLLHFMQEARTAWLSTGS